VLLNPFDSRTVVRSCAVTGSAVEDFRELLGLTRNVEQVAERRWLDAAADVRDNVIETGADGVQHARRLGLGAVSRTKVARDRVSEGVADMAARRRGDGGTD
jgi:hypothetical protein